LLDSVFSAFLSQMLVKKNHHNSLTQQLFFLLLHRPLSSSRARALSVIAVKLERGSSRSFYVGTHVFSLAVPAFCSWFSPRNFPCSTLVLRSHSQAHHSAIPMRLSKYGGLVNPRGLLFRELKWRRLCVAKSSCAARDAFTTAVSSAYLWNTQIKIM
jgi:hypothetical protein